MATYWQPTSLLALGLASRARRAPCRPSAGRVCRCPAAQPGCAIAPVAVDQHVRARRRRPSRRPASATTTTGNSSPLAEWTVISTTASPPSSAIAASPSRAARSACSSQKRTNPSRSGPRSCSYSRASRISLRTLASRRSPSGRASSARSKSCSATIASHSALQAVAPAAAPPAGRSAAGRPGPGGCRPPTAPAASGRARTRRSPAARRVASRISASPSLDIADQRRRQHRQQRAVVGAVDQQPQVGDQIPHLLLAVVAAAGGAHGRQALPLQRVLVGAGVGACLEQQHHAARAAHAGVHQLATRAGRSRAASAWRQAMSSSRQARTSVSSSSTSGAGGSPSKSPAADQVVVAAAELAAERLVHQVEHVRPRAVVLVERDHRVAGHRHAARGRPRRRRGGTGRCSGTRRRPGTGHRRRPARPAPPAARLVSWNSSTITSANRSR